MAKDKPEGAAPPKPGPFDKILNEDRIGLAEEQRRRRKLRTMKVFVSVEFDQNKTPKITR